MPFTLLKVPLARYLPSALLLLSGGFCESPGVTASTTSSQLSPSCKSSHVLASSLCETYSLADLGLKVV